MKIILIIVGFLLGYLIQDKKVKKKNRECALKTKMIENRDILIGNQESKINELRHKSLLYEQIKFIYKNEPNIISRHDKAKELIDMDN